MRKTQLSHNSTLRLKSKKQNLEGCLGDIVGSHILGYKSTSKYIYTQCPKCGVCGWVKLRGGKVTRKMCQRCNCAELRLRINWGDRKGEKGNGWKGGRHTEKGGYVKVFLNLGDFFYPMATRGGYVLEHRLVMARHLKRCLQPWEIVHHKGTKYPKGSIENRSDNRIENLQLVQEMQHKQITIFENMVRVLEKRILRLETDNELLRKQLEGVVC